MITVRAMIVKVFFGCTSLASAGSQASATEDLSSGNYYLSNCREEERGTFKSGLCYGYLTGFADMHTNSVTFRKKPDYCQPDEVTKDQLRKILVRYLQNHPERLHKPVFLLHLAALSEAFPCRSNLATGFIDKKK